MDNIAAAKFNMAIPRFDGNGENLPRYLLLLQSTADLYGCGYIMITNPAGKLPDDDEELDPANLDHKQKLKWKSDNAKMMTLMIHGQSDDHVLIGVLATKSAKRAAGSVYEAVNWLRREFLHGDDLDETFFEQELNDVCLAAGEDPREITKQLAKILIKFSFTLTDSRRVAIIKRCAMTQYSSVLTTSASMIKLTKNRNPYAFELMELLVADYKMRKGPIGQLEEPTETALGDVTRKRG